MNDVPHTDPDDIDPQKYLDALPPSDETPENRLDPRQDPDDLDPQHYIDRLAAGPA